MIPRRAAQEGVSGLVKAQALVQSGVVKEVTILSGPRIFHSAVRTAMLQYTGCTVPDGTVVVQEFAFKIE